MLIPLSPQAPAPFLVGRAPPPRFVGRSSEIELIHTLLQGDERAAGLAGPSGIGKTALALAYAHRFREAYPGGVFWVDASSGPADEIASLARAVGLSAAGPASDRRRLLVLAFADFLRARPNALFVLDDVDPPWLDTRLLGFAPIELPCRILFTTTANADHVPLAVLPLDVLTEDAVASLFTRADADERATRAARRLASLLGGNPLAATAAAAWLGHAQGRSLADLAGDLDTSAETVIRLGYEDVAGEERRLLELVAVFSRGALMSAARLALFAGLGELEEKRVATVIEALALRGLVDALEHGAAARIAIPVRAAVEAAVGDVAAVRRGVLSALERAYENLGRLEREVARRGARAVLADLRAAEVDMRAGGLLGALRATLELEVGALDAWDPAREPSFFLQQLRERADDLGLDDLASRAAELLAARSATYLRARRKTRRHGEASSRVLEGHTGKVNAVAITKDGRTCVSASEDRTLRVWDLETAEALFVLVGHTGAVRGVAISADGRLAVSAAMDDALIVWDLDAGRPRRFLRGHADVAHSVAFSKGGREVVSGSEDRAVRVWDTATGRLLSSLASHGSGVHGVAVTEDGRSCVSATWDEPAVRLWSIDEGRVVSSLDDPMTPVSAVAMTPEGASVVAASFEDTVLHWLPHEGSAPGVLEGHMDSVTSVAITSDGCLAVSGSWDHTVRVWDLEAREELRALYGHNNAVWSVAMTPDGKRVVSGSEDRTVRVWDLAIEPNSGLSSEVRPPCLSGHEERISALVVSRDGATAVSASFDDTLRVWDAGRGSLRAVLEGHTLWVYGAAIAAEGRVLVSASVDGSVKVWDLGTGKLLQDHARLPGRGPGATVPLADGVPLCAPLLVDERGMHVITSTEGGDLASWDLQKGERAQTFSSRGVLPTAGALASGRLFIGGMDGRLVAWDLASGARIAEGNGHGGVIRSVALSQDGGVGVSASDDQTLRVWDVSTGRSTRVLSGHTRPVSAVALAADGRHAVSASEDRTLCVWDLSTGEARARLSLREPVDALALGPGGRTIVTGDRVGHVSFLSLEGAALA